LKNFGLLRGPKILVKAFPKQELKQGSIIVAEKQGYRGTESDLRPDVGEVIAVGDGYDDGDGGLQRLETVVGQVIWFTDIGATKFKQLPGSSKYYKDGFLVTTEDKILKVWNNKEEFEAWAKEQGDE
jgi:co-chaperonin GroES (HSP10)